MKRLIDIQSALKAPKDQKILLAVIITVLARVFWKL